MLGIYTGFGFQKYKGGQTADSRWAMPTLPTPATCHTKNTFQLARFSGGGSNLEHLNVNGV